MTLAEHSGASTENVTGDRFKHLLISQIPPGEIEQLHLYIGGDGQAFKSRLNVSQDPTPNKHIALELMLADPAPAIFVSRPCYYTSAKDKNCNAKLWTRARYSPAVISSIVAVVERLARRYPQAAITMVGYSGGGVIALLVATHLPQVTSVITIASPLDIDAWTTLHGYSPLRESLNPTTQSNWPANLRQLHLSAAQDKNVPPGVQKNFRQSLDSQGVIAEFRTLPTFTHQCCWLDAWADILKLQQQPRTDTNNNKQPSN